MKAKVICNGRLFDISRLHIQCNTIIKIRFFLILITLTILLCGCQPTPEKPAVINKVDGKLQNIIQSTPVPDASDATRKITTETQWTELYCTENLKCEFNAQIILPDANSFPVYKVAKRSFDSADVNNLVKYFSKDATGVRLTSETKEELEEQLIMAKKGTYVEDDNGGRWEPYDGQQEEIANLERQIANAKREVFNPITSDPVTLPVNNTYAMPDGSKVYIKADANNFSFTTEKYGILQPESWIKSGDAMPGEPAGTMLNNVKITEKAACEKASGLISALGIENMGIAETEKGCLVNGFTGRIPAEGWCVTFARNDGHSIPVNLNSPQLNGMLDFEAEDYAERWFPETITVFVDETGIRSFLWINPLDVVQTMNTNISLLSFEDIKERIKKNIEFGYSKRVQSGQINNIQCKITVTKIILANVLVPIKDDIEHEMLLPAWLVYYVGSFEAGGVEYKDPITVFAVNAADGSAIDLSMRFCDLRSN